MSQSGFLWVVQYCSAEPVDLAREECCRRRQRDERERYRQLLTSITIAAAWPPRGPVERARSSCAEGEGDRQNEIRCLDSRFPASVRISRPASTFDTFVPGVPRRSVYAASTPGLADALAACTRGREGLRTFLASGTVPQQGRQHSRGANGARSHHELHDDHAEAARRRIMRPLPSGRHDDDGRERIDVSGRFDLQAVSGGSP